MVENLIADAVTISVDVEGWLQSTWNHSLNITHLAAFNTERVLDFLAARQRKATMFVLGKFAERFPNVVKRIASEGHEVASHGHGHIEIFRQTPEQFREDVKRAKSLLEDLTGQPVVGYRAPDFSIVARTVWALNVLAETGHRYDSSIFPIKHGRYGIAWWPTNPVRVMLPEDRSIIELSLATLTVLGRNWPIAGGGYYRLLPWPIIQWAIARRLHETSTFMTYCHPYEFNPYEFKILGVHLPLRTRLHQGLGRRGFRNKFERLLRLADNVPARDVALLRDWPAYHLPERAYAGV